MMIRTYIAVLLFVGLVSCEEAPLQAVGMLQSDRLELLVEYAEPIESIVVREGDRVQAGDIVLTQNSERMHLRLREAEANVARISALLAEQEAGPRVETIAAARASLSEARIEQEFRSTELDRLRGLRSQNLTSVESVDTARKLLASAGARVELATAQLNELLAGTRLEQLEQTRQMLAQAEAQQAQLALNVERHTIRAPVAGVIDSLPLESGERPGVNSLVAVLLAGEQPLARVYIPEPMRVQIAPGDRVTVHIDGLEEALTGRVRNVASEASFTPYFALTERDRSRLSYLAEIELPSLAERLPDGVPVQLGLLSQD